MSEGYYEKVEVSTSIKSGAMKLGSYIADGSIDVSSYHAASANEFVLVPTASKGGGGDQWYRQNSNYTYANYSGGFSIGDIKLNDNTLSFTLPRAYFSGKKGSLEDPYWTQQQPIPCDIYFIGAQ